MNDEKKKTLWEMASRGGEARAKSLSKNEREDIARKAAQARWAKEGSVKGGDPVLAITQGTMEFGGVSITCAVLDDGKETRVIAERSLAEALGVARSGHHWEKKKGADAGKVLPVYLSKKYLVPFISDELKEIVSNPIVYKPATGGNIGHGTRADVLTKICEVWIDARNAGALTVESQVRIANLAEIIHRGIAATGVIALVDEATGYQSIRNRRSLQNFLNQYIQAEYRKWTKVFPDEYYSQLMRLNKWKPKDVGSTMRPPVIGKITNDIVYERLAPGTLKRLQKVNPSDEAGRRKRRHHQHLTEDLGEPALRDHLTAIIALMKASTSYVGFRRLLDKAIPKPGTNLEFDIDKE